MGFYISSTWYLICYDDFILEKFSNTENNGNVTKKYPWFTEMWLSIPISYSKEFVKSKLYKFIGFNKHVVSKMINIDLDYFQWILQTDSSQILTYTMNIT